MIRVLIADDQQVIRQGFRAFLEPFDDIAVVGEATSGAQAVAMARELEPDVVLMDVRMPDGDGIAATRQLAGPDVPDPTAVIVVTTFDVDEYVFGSLHAGAVGFLLKDVDPADLATAIRVAARGDALVSPAVTKRVIAEVVRRDAPHSLPGQGTAGSSAAGSHGTASPGHPDGLTEREVEIIGMVAQGLSNAEIGERLHLVPGTIKSYLTRVNHKTATRNRVQIAVWALANGLAPMPASASD